MNTIKKVKNYIEKNNMISPNDTIIVGVSGGADSVCLFTILNELKNEYNLTLKVVHINHMIREDAMEDANYVKQLCEQNNVAYTLVCEDVEKKAKENRLSTEDMGRRIRYQAFANMVDGENCKIAVAHNENDVNETFFLNLFRGAGLNGLCSIQPTNELNGNKIIRPIMCLSRKEIESFLNEKQIDFKTDTTNLECDYNRNKVRNVIIPYVEENIHENAGKNISRAISLLNETNDFVRQTVDETIQKCVKTFTYEDGDVYLINVNDLLAQHIMIQKMIIKEILGYLIVGCKDVSMTNIEDILSICSKDGSKQICITNDIVAYKEFGCLRIKKQSTKEIKEESLQKDLFFVFTFCSNKKHKYISQFKNCDNNVLEISKAFRTGYYEDLMKRNCAKGDGTTQFVTGDIARYPITLRMYKEDDYIVLNKNKVSLKTYMNQKKIPYNTLLLANGNEVVWVFGQKHLNSNYYVKPDEQTFLQIHVK